MDTPNQKDDDALWRDATWAADRLAVLLDRLAEQVRRGQSIPRPPFGDTLPGVRWVEPK